MTHRQALFLAFRPKPCRLSRHWRDFYVPLITMSRISWKMGLIYLVFTLRDLAMVMLDSLTDFAGTNTKVAPFA